jgi:Schlafen, AlbA_2
MDSGSISSTADIERLISNEIPEGPSLEYKRTLSLGARAERLEVLKDISGMGNGGGGTLIYGLEEAGDGLPAGLHVLSDPRDVGRLEDIVRSGTSPPLLSTLNVLEQPGGYVLVVHVQRSPLGPYMVEAYDQRRYFTRVGSRTAPMTEQQVRDAYLLAARGRERRSELWQEHYLPIRAESSTPWLMVSALPEEPLLDLFDPAQVEVDAFRPPAEFALHAQLARLDKALATPQVWAEGVFGQDRYESSPRAIVRLHRDGAAGLAVSMPQRVPHHDLLRALNAQLLYLGWLWAKLGTRTPIELDVQVVNLGDAAVVINDWGEQRSVARPPGVPVDRVRVRREVLPSQLQRASIRHGLVQEFANRLYQAFGLRHAQVMFQTGWLFGPDGVPLGLSLLGRCLWDSTGTWQRGWVYEGGLIENAANNQVIAGYLVGGAILDDQGRTMAVLELASGQGVPDDFVHRQVDDDPRARVPGDPGPPHPTARPFQVPTPLGIWSDLSLLNRLRPDARS